MRVQRLLALALTVTLVLLTISFLWQILFFPGVTFISLLIALTLTSIFIGFLKLILLPIMLTKPKRKIAQKMRNQTSRDLYSPLHRERFFLTKTLLRKLMGFIHEMNQGEMILVRKTVKANILDETNNKKLKVLEREYTNFPLC